MLFMLLLLEAMNLHTHRMRKELSVIGRSVDRRRAHVRAFVSRPSRVFSIKRQRVPNPTFVSSYQRLKVLRSTSKHNGDIKQHSP